MIECKYKYDVDGSIITPLCKRQRHECSHDKLSGCDIDKYILSCTKCRSQIEQETRQKCWEDILQLLADYSAHILIPDTIKWELKKKWRMK